MPNMVDVNMVKENSVSTYLLSYWAKKGYGE